MQKIILPKGTFHTCQGMTSTVKHHKLPEIIFCQLNIVLRLKPICNATTFVIKHFVHLQTTKRTPGLQIYRTKKKNAQ